MLTHFMDATLFSDYLIVMHNGKIIVEGKPLEVWKKKEILKKVRVKLPSLLASLQI